MRDNSYAEIAKIFWNYTGNYNIGVLGNIFLKYALKRERPIDIIFKKITNGLKYESQPYEIRDDHFNYRASSWIFTIAWADVPESEKNRVHKDSRRQVNPRYL